MKWGLLLLAVLAVSLLMEWQGLRKTKRMSDRVLYLTVWGLSLLLVLADCMELSWLRPLDWVKIILYPVNRLLP